METAFVQTPLGVAKIVGNEDGIAVISILETDKVTTIIPVVLQEAVKQLNDYFAGNRNDFDF